MEIKIPRLELSAALALASRVAARKPSMPILANVLLRADRHRLLVAATDLNVSLTAEVPCHVDAPGGVTVNAADLQRFVVSSTGGEVSIKTVDTNWSIVQCGKSRYRIPGMSDRDFPKVPAAPANAVECDAAVLGSMLARAGHAASLEESAEALCGVYVGVDANGQCTMASTNRHKVSMVTGTLSLPQPAGGGAVLCRQGAIEFAHLLEDQTTCRVTFTDRHMVVQAGGVLISAGLLDFKHPIELIRKAIAVPSKASAVVGRAALLAAIKRVSPLTNEYSGIRLTSTSTGLSLLSHKEGAEIADEVECEVTGEIRVCFNASYAVDVIGHMAGDAITVRVPGEMDPVVFVDNDDPGHTGLVMPMRM